MQYHKVHTSSVYYEMVYFNKCAVIIHLSERIHIVGPLWKVWQISHTFHKGPVLCILSIIFYHFCHLPAKIQHMKHSVPKGDKKKKKQIMGEIALLQSKLEEKHRSEIEEYSKIKKPENFQVMLVIEKF